MSLSKQFLPPSTDSVFASEVKPEFHQRMATLFQKIVLRPWVQNYMLSRSTQMAIDALIVLASFVLAHALRFDGWPPGVDGQRMIFALPYVVVLHLIVNNLMGLYRRVWRYVSIPDAIHLACAVGVISFSLLTLRLLIPESRSLWAFPIGTIVIDFLLATFGLLGARMLWRVACENAARAKTQAKGLKARTLLVGAGDAGIMTAREISRRRDLGFQVCGFLDDDPSKLSSVIQGVSVLGTTSALPQTVRQHNVDQVIITMANARRKTVRRILDLCEEAEVPVKIIPGLYEILGNQVTVSNVRRVEIEDLLGRDTINVNAWLEASQGSYTGKRVLITGAGGSIGRELCRQIATLNPAAIILLDKDENSVFEAEREVRAACQNKKIEIVPAICDLRVMTRMRQVFAKHRPQVVMHAAAHKHVPLMESNVAEAIFNNVVGTQRLLECAAEFNVERCVMVSTDKAVNPTNIMGATKRVSELMFQAQAVRLNGGRHYSCVRFGNVLGSRGSVVPIFREQIKNGGPVTVTHPDVERYFMTIPEAAQLIIQAGALGQRGEIFLLDMGEPVKMFDLAKDMIRLSGLTVGEDVDIEFTGLRPGEKMTEELLIAEEGAETTRYEKIFVAPPLQYDFARLDTWLARLTAAAEAGNEDAIYETFSAMGIGFRPTQWKPKEVAERAAGSGH
ncbi:MAG TPA: nucleoside-diphosphate sugar epimerase/dehydratase [Blastocatellia bacterium]|nr:nucleoside-diphosphate sugar epimerase/dehydratase [Blastocatellia bacterium]HMY73848.1 nucleoside-diphosphate sugar epimerase/dehydratase [Blastocatellia bacterium]HMZ20825.1 nucleoside-diphosphate sugar epimerase/dehydratase [Blastocatellia bacterium]HNG33467.1 nucleoside-diphosphate sugar epimerase/dehydratase [Blastocatellia bacterium]